MQVESPREPEIRTAVEQLRAADAGTLAQVERLARQLPRDVFAATVEKLEQRRKSGTIKNDAGLLVHLLEAELKGQRAAAAEAAVQAAAAVERYVRAMRGRPGFELERYLDEYVDDEQRRERLRKVAA